METIVRDVDAFVCDFAEQMRILITHHFISTTQTEFFKDMQFNLKEEEMIVICDFAENYTYYKGTDGTIHCKSVIVIAESLKHDVNAVHLFQRKLIHLIQNSYPHIKTLIFFSDGAASQYKNRKNFYNICQFKETYGYDVEWHFFATSHGKSAFDALGGSFKRDAARASLQKPGEVFITNAKQLFEWTQKKTNSRTSFIFCSDREHEEESQRSRNRYNDIRGIQGTQSFHFFKPLNAIEVEARRFSYDTRKQIFSLK